MPPPRERRVKHGIVGDPTNANGHAFDMLPGRLSQLPPSSFAKLATLARSPSARHAADQSGGRRSQWCGAALRAARRSRSTAEEFGIYPPINGNKAWREAAAAWLVRRFALPAASIDPDKNLLPLNGTREGLVPGAVHGDAGDEGRAAAGGAAAQSRSINAMRRRRWRRAASRCSCRRRRRRDSCPTMRRCPSPCWSGRRRSTSARRRIPKAPAPARTIGARCSRWRTNTTSRCSRTNAMPTSIWTSRRSARSPCAARRMSGC